MSLAGGSRLGPYEVVAAIGAGGMGEVFRARDTKLNRDVAIKVLPAAFAQDAERAARFKREAQILASLTHANIAGIYGLEETSGSLALAMEYVAGEDLAARLARGPLPLEEAVAIAKQIAEALEEAHEHGIVHRDLKPANVKLTPDGKVKVLDFGLAKALEGDGGVGSGTKELSHSPTLTHQGTVAGVILGTAAYMSPEQARGRKVDKRADIWSFGVVLFEMLTGRRLFAGETASDILAAVLKTEPDWASLPEATPPFLRHLLRRCLERDPRRRLQAIGEARIALEVVDATDSTAPKRGSLAPWLVAAALALVAGWALISRRPPSAAPPGVARLDVAFPADIEPVPSLDGAVAISPDGQRIGILGVKSGGRALFVRRLDSPEATEIRVSGLTATAFSPDSKSVAVLGSRLVSISLADGQQTVIRASPDLSATVAWANDSLVFARNGALWIGGRGGEPRALTTLDPARREVVHGGQMALPGGRTILFTSFTTESGTERIEAVSVDGGPRSVVVERATTPIWSATGHLLFARDGALLAMPFDAAAVKATGAAMPVIPAGVIRATSNGSLGVRLSSNGTLLFIDGSTGAQRVVSVARDGAALVLGLPRGQYLTPRVAPDGRRVVVVSNTSLLETLHLERGSKARLSSSATGTGFPLWTQDGSGVVSRRFNRPYWVSADGSREGEVKGAQNNDFPSAAGPDPDSIIVSRVVPDNGGDAYLLSISGRFEPKPLVATKAYEGGAQLSRDGRWFVYCSDLSGQMQVYVRPYPALDRQWPISEGPGHQPRWSANGREIYFRDGESMMAVSFDGSKSEPLIGKPVALFKDDYDLGQGLTIANYDVTPDGRFIMLRREAQAGTLRIVLNWTEELKQILARGGAR